VPDLLTTVPERALAVYAHPDDPDVACGGTLAQWAMLGCEVTVVICNDGGKGSKDPDDVPAQLRLRRRKEAEASASLLGIRHQEFLDYPDGEVENDLEFRSRLVAIVRQRRPDVVFTADPTAMFFGQGYYNHRDHRVVGEAVLDAVAPAAALPHYFPAAGPVHQVTDVLLSGTLEPDVWVEIGATVDAKGAAVGCHRSQFPDGEEWASAVVRIAAEDAGHQAGVTFAEGFKRLHLGG
jgi:LmbE family N-acetylglucosaminyl deacetylase